MKMKDWLQPGKLNRNMVLQILLLLLSEDEKKPVKVKVETEVKEAKPKQIFDDLNQNDAYKFLPKKTD